MNNLEIESLMAVFVRKKIIMNIANNNILDYFFTNFNMAFLSELEKPIKNNITRV